MVQECDCKRDGFVFDFHLEELIIIYKAQHGVELRHNTQCLQDSAESGERKCLCI